MILTWALVEALFASLAAAWNLLPWGQWIPALILAGLAGFWGAVAWVMRYTPGMAVFCVVDGLLSLTVAWEVVKV